MLISLSLLLLEEEDEESTSLILSTFSLSNFVKSKGGHGVSNSLSPITTSGGICCCCCCVSSPSSEEEHLIGMFVFFASLVAALAFIDVEYKNAIVVVVVDVVLDDIDLLLPGINNKNNLVRRVRATTTISLFRKIKENAAKQMQQQTNNRAVKRSQLQLVCTTSAVLETHHPTNTKIEEMDDFVSQFPPRFPKQD